MSEILVTKHAALIEHDGQTFILKAGTTVRAGHPITDGRAGLFEPLVVQYDLADDTETADAPVTDQPGSDPVVVAETADQAVNVTKRGKPTETR